VRQDRSLLTYKKALTSPAGQSFLFLGRFKITGGLSQAPFDLYKLIFDLYKMIFFSLKIRYLGMGKFKNLVLKRFI
jgi:hypothetical protein